MIRDGIEYRPWPRDQRYFAGEDGSIIGARGRVRPPRLDDRGRPAIGVRVDGRSRSVRVHVIVAEAWHGLRPPGHEVAHGNGVHTDNRPANLSWKTHIDNEADKREHGTLRRGERVPRARLTEVAVRAIRAAYAAGGVSHSDLARRYGVSAATVGLAVQGRTWAHVEGVSAAPRPTVNRGERCPHARLTAAAVREIRGAAAGGVTVSALARRHGVSRTAIRNVLTGQTWGHVA